MTSTKRPLCMTCAHYKLLVSDQLEKMVCVAFPGGIPEEIIMSDHDHRQPHPDDGGIQYEALPGTEEEA